MEFACLTTGKRAEFQSKLEQYLPHLERELANCDWANTELRRSLRMRRAHMRGMIKRLKETQA